MTQPAGMVCGADADVGFLLRSSPLICITDAVLLLSRLGYEYHREGSFRNARDKMIGHRFQGAMYDGFKAAKRAGYEIRGRYEDYFRMVVFVLTLAQTVKLFAFGGMVWPKVLAALYLASFLVIEALVVWPVARMDDIKDVDKTKSALTEHASVALAVVFMLWFASTAARDIFGQPHHTLPQWSAVVIASMGTVLALAALGYSCRHARTWGDVRVPMFLLIFVLGAPVGFYFTGRIVPETTPVVLVQVICAMLSAVWGGIALLYASQITEVIRRDGKERQRKKVEQITAWYFFFLHLITALLYFLYSYDAAGTTKPAWTEYLE
jgi:hypothetical protein